MKFAIEIDVTDGIPKVLSCKVLEPERIPTRALKWQVSKSDMYAYETATADAPELEGRYMVRWQRGYPVEATISGGSGHGAWGSNIEGVHGVVGGSLIDAANGCARHFREAMLKQIADRKGDGDVRPTGT